jgi:hypothetical protein
MSGGEVTRRRRCECASGGARWRCGGVRSGVAGGVRSGATS